MVKKYATHVFMKTEVSSLKWCILYVNVLVIFPEIAFQKRDVYKRQTLLDVHSSYNLNVMVKKIIIMTSFNLVFEAISRHSFVGTSHLSLIHI